MTDTKTEWYIIVNPHAGSGKTIEEWSLAEMRLSDLGVPYEYRFTGYKSHAKELAYKAAVNGYRNFIAVGGDGSIHEIVTGVLTFAELHEVNPEDFTVGVIPIGSGNDWIKSLDVPHDTKKVVDIISAASVTRQDVVRVVSAGNRVCYMANVGGVGFDSHVCERVNAKKERGRRSKRIYINALIYTILHLKRISVEVIGDGKTLFSGPCYSIAIGNGKYSGSGMLQTADAVLNDGLLDVMIVPVMPLTRIIKEACRIFNGTISQSKFVKYSRCSNLRIVPLNAKSSDIVEIDGEIEGCLPLEVSLSGKQINALTGIR